MRLLRTAWNWEVAMWHSLYLWARRKPVRPPADGEVPFPYAGITAPILWTFIILSAVEIPMLDVILTHAVPWEPARWIALSAGAWGLFWCIGLLASMKIRPHLVGPAGVQVRAGHNLEFFVPWEQIASVSKGVRPLPSNKTVQAQPGILMITQGGQTNLDLRLTGPVTLAPHDEPVEELRLHADDADGFVAAARARLGARVL